MENKRSKVLISILLVVLCLSVCVGLTYAYFTDSAKSSGNKIQAGNLKLDLELYDKENGWASIKDSSAPVFDYAKWEPGYVDAKLLKIENLGDLAMQWEAKLVSDEAVSEFANAIEVYVQQSDTEFAHPASRGEALDWTFEGTLDQFINTAEKLASGTFTAQGEAYYIGIALYMPAEITDNTLQGQILGAFDIQINATQLAYESDAFDESYDADAKFPCDHSIIEVIEGYDATYFETGLTDGKKCKVCGEMLEKQVDIPVLVEKEYPDFVFTLSADETYYTVRGATSLTSADIIIPRTYYGLPVKEIENTAFYGCDSITSIIIPDSITSFGFSAFSACSNLTSITIPDSVTSISNQLFYACENLTSVTIPDSVTSIGYGAFNTCTNLTSINIPDSVKSIGEIAFSGCVNLTNITIPNGVTSIGDCAFAGCDSLTDITIPNGVTSISSGMFYQCENLESVTIPDSVTTIGEDAFLGCCNLINFIVDENNAAYQSISGNLYTKDGTVLVAYACGKADTILTLSDNVTTIGASAFGCSNNLTSVIIPSSVTTIGVCAFQHCDALTSITIGKNVTTIDAAAFCYCFNLTNITFEGTVAQWNAIAFGPLWNGSIPATYVQCSNGTVTLN